MRVSVETICPAARRNRWSTSSGTLSDLVNLADLDGSEFKMWAIPGEFHSVIVVVGFDHEIAGAISLVSTNGPSLTAIFPLLLRRKRAVPSQSFSPGAFRFVRQARYLARESGFRPASWLRSPWTRSIATYILAFVMPPFVSGTSVGGRNRHFTSWVFAGWSGSKRERLLTLAVLWVKVGRGRPIEGVGPGGPTYW